MMGWHVQVIAPLPVLLASMNVLAHAPVPLVIDHYGLYGHERPGSPAGGRLLDLMSLPQVWMKLSAPYRHDRGPLNTKPDREWLAALIAAAPDRCVWGSDWPHPPSHEQQRARRSASTARCPAKRWSTVHCRRCRQPVLRPASWATTRRRSADSRRVLATSCHAHEGGASSNDSLAITGSPAFMTMATELSRAYLDGLLATGQRQPRPRQSPPDETRKCSFGFASSRRL
jgi:hypothetical protein